MRVREFEALMKTLLERSRHPSIQRVETFKEAGYDQHKPVGLKVTFKDGAEVYTQFVAASPPGGDAARMPTPDYEIPANLL